MEDRINMGQGRKVFKHVVHQGMNIHRSVLTRLEALDREGQAGTYHPQVRPNIVVKRNDGHEIRHCQRIRNDDWRKGVINGMDRSWFKWV